MLILFLLLLWFLLCNHINTADAERKENVSERKFGMLEGSTLYLSKAEQAMDHVIESLA